MRSFYIDDSDNNNEKIQREYFVKIENITISENMKYTQIITACNPIELKDKICNHYGFQNCFNKDIQLWSGSIGSTKRIRLDTLDNIPYEYDTVYVRGTLIKS
jgi:hypothetical protein